MSRARSQNALLTCPFKIANHDIPMITKDREIYQVETPATPKPAAAPKPVAAVAPAPGGAPA